MNADIYSESFYEQTTPGSLVAARHVLPQIWQRRQFSSVIDVGCGVGTWLLAAKELGASQLCGIEGPWLPANQLLVDRNLIRRRDLCQTIELGDTFDLCICLEVAEHLPGSRAESLVEDLVRLSSVVAFSAAVPFQGGDGHLNELWPEYWARLFGRHDYLPWGGLRRAIWHIRDIPWWYRQNLIVYVARSAWNSLLPTETPDHADYLTNIHPESYLWNIHRPQGQLTSTYCFDVEAYYSLVAGDTKIPLEYGSQFPAPRPSKEDG